MPAIESFTPHAVEHDVLDIVRFMTSDWDLDPGISLGVETYLVKDLDCASIDIVELIVTLQDHFDRHDLPFEQLLMSDQRYVDDIRIQEVVDFLVKHLNEPEGR
jgi:acyl carrier protein